MKSIARAAVATPLFSEALQYTDSSFQLMEIIQRQTCEEEERLQQAHKAAMTRFFEDLREWRARKQAYLANALLEVMHEFPSLDWNDDERVHAEETKASVAFGERVPRPSAPQAPARYVREVTMRSGGEQSEEEKEQQAQRMRDGFDVQLINAKWKVYPHLFGSVMSVMGITDSDDE